MTRWVQNILGVMTKHKMTQKRQLFDHIGRSDSEPWESTLRWESPFGRFIVTTVFLFMFSSFL